MADLRQSEWPYCAVEQSAGQAILPPLNTDATQPSKKINQNHVFGYMTQDSVNTHVRVCRDGLLSAASDFRLQEGHHLLERFQTERRRYRGA